MKQDALEREELHFRGYIPGLDILRGLAIAMVVTYHGIAGRAGTGDWTGIDKYIVYFTTWGSSGVDLFYVLSGFLITGILVDSSRSADYYKRFYVHRALRILPAYFLMLLVLKLSHTISWAFVLAAVLYIANMASIVGAHDAEYGSFWSLAVEEQFYLIWPIIVRRCSLKTLTRIIAAYCVGAILFRMLVIYLHLRVDLGYKLWGNADWLLYGALVAVSLRTGALNRANAKKWMMFIGGIGLLSFPIVPYIDIGGHWNSLIGAFFRVPFLLIYVAVLLYVIQSNPGKTGVYRRGHVARFLAFLGYISYGLYLVHSLVFYTYEHLVSDTWLSRSKQLLPLFIGLLICGGISIGVAYLSRRYFESYFLRKKATPTKVLVSADTSSLVE